MPDLYATANLDDWNDFCIRSGGKCEYIFFVAGIPWAASTSPFKDPITGADQLTTGMRRQMFGAARLSDGIGGLDYPADTVPVVSSLVDVGAFSMRLDDNKAQLAGSNMTIKIARSDPGITWPHNYTSRTIAGLEGLDTTPHPKLDPLIYSAKLSSSFQDGDAAIDCDDDAYSRLNDLIDTRAATGNGLWTYLWVGNEVLAVKSTPVSGAGTFTAGSVLGTDMVRGLYKTKPHTHNVDEENGVVGARVGIAPLGGIANRPCYLFAIPVDKDGAPTSTDPYQVFHGKVSSRIDYDADGTFSVSCEPWIKALDRDMRFDQTEGVLRGYIFSRSDGTAIDETHVENAGCGHLVIHELVDVGGPGGTFTWKRKKIWLCTQDSDVKYETVQDVIDAVQTELDLAYAAGEGGTTAVNGSDGLSYEYLCDALGICHQDPAQLTLDGVQDNDFAGWVSGPVPWILNMNPIIIGSDVSNREEMDAFFKGDPLAQELFMSALGNHKDAVVISSGASTPQEMSGSQFWRSSVFRRIYADPQHTLPGRCYHTWSTVVSVGLSTITLYSQYHIGNGAFRSPYAVQWGWTNETANAHYSDSPEWGVGVEYFIWPGGGSPFVYIDNGRSVTDFDLNDSLWIGLYGPQDFLQGRSNRLVFDIVDVTTNGNYLTVGTQKIPELGNLETEAGLLGNGLSLTTETTPSPIRHGMFLLWFPAAENWGGDALAEGSNSWPVGQSFTASSWSLSNLVRSFLGDPLGSVDVPSKFQADGIPDSFDRNIYCDDISTMIAEEVGTIDWVSFNQVVSPVFTGQYYRMYFGDKFNLWEAFCQELLFHGVQPRWTWDAGKNQYRMTFAKGLVATTTEAWNSGRILDGSVRRADVMTTGEASGSHIFSNASVKLHYNPNEDKFMVSERVTDGTGYEALGGKPSTMKIEALFSRKQNYKKDDLELIEEITEHLHALLYETAFPLSQQNVETTMAAWTLLTPGCDFVVTDDFSRTPITGEDGITNWPARVLETRFDFMRGRGEVSYRLSRGGPSSLLSVRGWGPTLNIPKTSGSSVHSANEVDILPSPQRYNNTSGRTALSWFDCYRFNQSTNVLTLDPNCGCSDYAVLVIEADSKTPTVYADVTIGSVDLTNGTARLTKTGMGSTWDTAKRWIVVFEDLDAAGLQDCQKRWLYLATPFGQLVDSDATNHPAQEWV